MTFTPVVFEKSDEVNAAYEAGRCDVFTTDASGLYAFRLTFQNPDEHIVLPEIISKEPLGPVVRQGDDQWFNIVKWTHFALLEAEEYGITQANVEEMKTSDNPTIKRILGDPTTASSAKAMGLTNDWVVNIIKARRQLRRDLRAQYRRGLAAEDRARPERSVERRRTSVRSADPLIARRTGPDHESGPYLMQSQRNDAAGGSGAGGGRDGC